MRTLRLESPSPIKYEEPSPKRPARASRVGYGPPPCLYPGGRYTCTLRAVGSPVHQRLMSERRTEAGMIKIRGNEQIQKHARTRRINKGSNERKR